MTASSKSGLTFQELIFTLQKFWAEQGCILQQPYDVEMGAGTMAPETFLRVLGPRPYKVAYLQPSRRPADGRYGDNPNRLFKHTQLQAILKPPPGDIQELYLRSLEAIGIDLRKHDLKFEEDNWESPTLGAWGIGWQVMLDGMEITQFTYFQQCGGVDLDPISAELTYGLERLCAFLQDVDSVYDIVWARDPRTGAEVTYRDVRHAEEYQFSVYNFETADIEKTWEHLCLYEAECKQLLPTLTYHYESSPTNIRVFWGSSYLMSNGRHTTFPDGSTSFGDLKPYSVFKLIPEIQDGSVPRLAMRAIPVELGLDCGGLVTTPRTGVAGGSGTITVANALPQAAFDLCLKCSHLFNILDARGAISVTERVGVIARIRSLAVAVANAYLDMLIDTIHLERLRFEQAEQRERTRQDFDTVGNLFEKRES